MRRRISLLLAICMTLVLCMLPVSATEAEGEVVLKPEMTLEEVKATGLDYLQLSHANVKEFDNTDGVILPESIKNDPFTIGTVTYTTDNCTFINVKGATGTAGDPTGQTPGFASWDISGKPYTVFQCDFGKGTWDHSGGAAVQLTVIAIDANGQELTIATSPFVEKGDVPVRVAALIPEDTVTLKATCSSIDGSNASCTSIIADAVVYTADEEYVPFASYQNGTVVFTKTDVGHVIYKMIYLDESFEITEGMTFCYDVYLDVDAPGLGACNINGTGKDMRDWAYTAADGTAAGGQGIGILDQNGIGAHPHLDISDYAFEQWYTREFDVSSLAGSMSSLLFAADSKTGDDTLVSGAGVAKFKNVLIKDAEGNVIWRFIPTQYPVDLWSEYTNPDNITVEIAIEENKGDFVSTGIYPWRDYFPETDTETEETPNSATKPQDSEPSDSKPADSKPADTKPADKEGGCGSMISAGALLLAAATVAPICFKRKK